MRGHGPLAQPRPAHLPSDVQVFASLRRQATAGIDGAPADTEWQALLKNPYEIEKWKAAGMTDAASARSLRDQGWTAEEAAVEVVAVRSPGSDPDTVGRHVQAGAITVEEAWVAKHLAARLDIGYGNALQLAAAHDNPDLARCLDVSTAAAAQRASAAISRLRRVRSAIEELGERSPVLRSLLPTLSAPEHNMRIAMSEVSAAWKDERDLCDSNGVIASDRLAALTDLGDLLAERLGGQL